MVLVHRAIHKNMDQVSGGDQSSSLATDSPGQLNVFGHDSHSLGVNGTQVGVLKKSNQIGFRCFLKGERKNVDR